jgi:putative ABC transport system permease protein
MPDWEALVRARLAPLAVDPARESDIIAEMAQHVAEHHGELVASGVPESEAAARALTPLDNPVYVASEIARADRLRTTAPVPPAEDSSLLYDLGRDVRYATRLLLRTPGFTAIALVTLALGIGANTAIFSILNAVLLRPLPYAAPERLVMIGDRGPDGSPGNVGYTTFLDWRDRSHAFEEMAIIRSWMPTLITNGEPERISGMRVSANFFQTLGVYPALGRDFRADEDTPSGWRVVMLSDGLWRRRFGADPASIGRAITMNDQQFTIVGVMPPAFEPLISEHFYQRAEMWALVGYDRSLPFACRSCEHLKALGRIKAGVPFETALRDIDDVQSQLRRELPADYPPQSMTIVPLSDVLTGGVRPALAVLMTAVAFVLLIACANVANLMLARLARREHDLALRAALGASRSRLVRQLLAENALLAGASAVLGIAFGAGAVPGLVRLAPAATSRLAAATLDLRVLGFSVALSVATALIFGLIPAIRASRIDLHASLHGDACKTAHAPTSLTRRVLVAADVAMAVVLLIGAGLMIKSVGRLLEVHPGFDPDHVLTMQISMVGQAYARNEAVVAKTDTILEKLRALPGVEAVATAGQIPLGGNGDTWGFHVQGREWGPRDPSVERYSVTPDYFNVMRIPLRRGRLLSDTDRANGQMVVVIGEQSARTIWPGADPLGQLVKLGGVEGPWFKVVGIVGDVRHEALSAPATMQMYTSQAQVTDSYLTVVIRAGGDPAWLAAEARRAIWSLASDVPVYEVVLLESLVAKSVSQRRFMMVLLELFGAIALLMTAVGVYGVIASSVAERTREIGVRSALGASSRDIVRLVVGGGMALIGGGLAAGGLVALAVTRYLEGSLYDVSATDPSTFAAVVLVLLIVAVIAQSVPVVRALRVDPTVALRHD